MRAFLSFLGTQAAIRPPLMKEGKSPSQFRNKARAFFGEETLSSLPKHKSRVIYLSGPDRRCLSLRPARPATAPKRVLPPLNCLRIGKAESPWRRGASCSRDRASWLNAYSSEHKPQPRHTSTTRASRRILPRPRPSAEAGALPGSANPSGDQQFRRSSTTRTQPL